MFDGLAFPIDVKGRARCLRSFVPLSAASLENGTNSGWAHVAMLGTWEGHSKGPFAFTPNAFTEILNNFSSQANPIPWDYEHDTFNPSTSGPKPASGWVKRLELRNNGAELWAYVDWTPKAADMIRNGEYRFCSPVVDFESLDRKNNRPIGAELLSVALTNNPFLDGQQPLQLKWIAASYPGAAPMAGNWPPNQPPQQPQGAPPQQQQQAYPPQQPQYAPQAAVPHGPAPMAAPPPPPPHGAPHAAPPGPPPQHAAPPAAPPGPPRAAPPGPPQPPPPAAAADAAKGSGSEADANAFLTALADAAGIDKSQTLAALLDIKDLLVQQIQKTISRDGTPAEARRAMSTINQQPDNAPAAAAPAAAPAAVQAAPSSDAIATLDDLERRRDKERLAELTARLEQIERERAAEKQHAIAQLVDEKIATGHVRQDQRDTAIWAFTTDRARAEQIYADKLIPLGVRQSQSGSTVPNQQAVAVNGEDLDESQFSRAELTTIACLVGAHKTRKQAIEIVMNKRSLGGRAN